ncbi:AIPR family protein [Aggregatibacter kilianii]|uniref:AIPR family protein n=1 Tax=Aggregatibacter kilianii TaxID=2025884 RepID=UPI000D659E83|nr:AIPR family protein [Aggregatibacter kilianii]
MTALKPEYMEMLKRVLEERFVKSKFLPNLQDNTKRPEDLHKKNLSRAFSAFVLQKLCDLSIKEAARAVVDDFNDKGIDAVYYHESTETLYLLQTKLKASEEFKQDDAQAFCEGVRLLINQEFDQFNNFIKNRKAEIENALDRCSHIQLVIPYTGNRISVSAESTLNSLLNDENLDEERLIKEIRYYTSDDIKRDLLAEQAFEKVNADIYLQKCQYIESPKKTYYGIISLSDLIKLHKQHGKGLYERNIRYFLGGKSSVNSSIKDTLERRPENFFYLNNGVTAICDLVEPKAKKREQNNAKKLKVRNISIINGAQTVASSAEFVAENPDCNIDEAKVMFTLIHAPSQYHFGNEITKARNHQNPVQIANFASLDENQERLRQEISCLGYGYYYRPEANIAFSGNSFGLQDAIHALSILENDPRFVVHLKADYSKLSNPDSKFYKKIFHNELSGVYVINAVLCYQEIRKLLIQADRQAPSRSLERMIYRHGIYAISAVIMKRLREYIKSVSVIDIDKIRSAISYPLDELRQKAFELGEKSLIHEGALAYFRNQGNVVAYLSELMEVNFNLSQDPAVIHLKNVRMDTQQESYPREKLFEYLSSKAPQIKESSK